MEAVNTQGEDAHSKHGWAVGFNSNWKRVYPLLAIEDGQWQQIWDWTVKLIGLDPLTGEAV